MPTLDRRPDPGGRSEEIRWRVHPLLDESRFKSGLLLSIVVGLSVGVWVSFEESVLGLVTFGLLGASLSRYLLPTRYVLDREGIKVSHAGMIRKMAWNRIRRISASREGLFLSPFAGPSRLDAFRGLFLSCRENRDEVMRFVRDRVSQDAV